MIDREKYENENLGGYERIYPLSEEELIVHNEKYEDYEMHSEFAYQSWHGTCTV